MVNVKNEIIKLNYKDLKRAVEGHPYRSICPICKKGVLLVGRNNKTLELQAMDYCILCGQHYIYMDIGELRKREEGEYVNML